MVRSDKRNHKPSKVKETSRSICELLGPDLDQHTEVVSGSIKLVILIVITLTGNTYKESVFQALEAFRYSGPLILHLSLCLSNHSTLKI